MWPRWYVPPRRWHFKSELIEAVATAFSIPSYDVTGPARYYRAVRARAVVAKALRIRGMSLPQIGKTLNRDHSTICSLLSNWDKRAAIHPEMDRVLDRVVLA